MPTVKEFTVKAHPIEKTEFGFRTIITVGYGIEGTLEGTLLASTPDELDAAIDAFGEALPFPTAVQEHHNPNGYRVSVKPANGRWAPGFKARFDNGKFIDKRTEVTV